MMRLKMSRPSASVPSHAVAEGARQALVEALCDRVVGSDQRGEERDDQ